MTKQPQRISVIVCAYTFDRWDDLGEAVASLQNQTRRPDEVLLIVDHNPELLARCAQQFPSTRVVANQRARGLSGARNTGIDLSTGENIAFLDDDATAHPDWLGHLERQLAREGVLGATNNVNPTWLVTRPEWFPDEFLWVVGCSFPGSQPTTGGEIRNVMGGAMLFRREVFETVGGFSQKLGRTEAGANLLSCEETELCLRAKAALPHGRFVSDASAIIWHKVPASRLSLRYFCLRTYAEGLSKAYLAALVAQAGALNTERSYVLRVLTRGILRNLGAAFTRLDPHGLARAGMIVLGLTCAVVGFLRGKGISAGTARRRDEHHDIPAQYAEPGARPGDAAAEG